MGSDVRISSNFAWSIRNVNGTYGPKWQEMYKIPLLYNKTIVDFCLFVWFDSLRPSQQFSAMSGRVFLGWTSNKQGLMCLAQFLMKPADLDLHYTQPVSTHWIHIKHVPARYNFCCLLLNLLMHFGSLYCKQYDQDQTAPSESWIFFFFHFFFRIQMKKKSFWKSKQTTA